MQSQRPRLFAVVVAATLSVTGCGGSQPTAKVVSRANADASVGGTLLVLPPRVCLDVQVDNVRRRRAGLTGLVRTRAVDRELRQALPSTVPRSRDEVSRGCAESLESSTLSAVLDDVRATPDLLARMREAGAQRAMLTEISTRLVCNPSSARSFGRWGTIFRENVDDVCFEDLVVVSAVTFDESGKPMQVAEIEVDDEDRAGPLVHALLASFHHHAPGSSPVPGACRMSGGAMLDCTGEPRPTASSASFSGR